MTASHPDGLRLRLERTITANRERVFAAWTRPELLKLWSAPEGLTVGDDGELDLRVGGRWAVTMLAPDGARHRAFGTYREVTPPARLVYTHAWRRDDGTSTAETTVTVEFVAEGANRTRVVLTQEGFDAAPSRDGHEEGWASTLDRLVALHAEAAA